MNYPMLGTFRADVFMLAGEALRKGQLVREMRRPVFSVKVAKRRHRILGVCCDDAAKGEYLWVRIGGPAPVLKG